MSGTFRIFLYGTLLDPELFGIVAGAPLEGQAARLPHFAVHWARGESFPLIHESAGGAAEGRLVTVDEGVKARLDFYEVGFGYYLKDVEAETEAGPVAARVYFPEDDRWPLGEAWSLARWQDAHGPLTRTAAVEYMRLFGRKAPEDAAASFAQIRSRATGTLRARARPSPDPFGDVADLGPAEIGETRQPYTGYFGVREDDLAFPLFRGGKSGVVTRASWLGADAVTVLPYDPRLDACLIVRQFRHGPFCRGDANPWCLEPVAGRIDAGETAEETARREMIEETGVEAGTLHLVGGYYPTPGAYSEHTTSYVCLSDLSGVDGRVGGEAGEAEDIMSHVIPFAELMEMAESGAANTGTLLVSLFWLKANRDRLRAI